MRRKGREGERRERGIAVEEKVKEERAVKEWQRDGEREWQWDQTG